MLAANLEIVDGVISRPRLVFGGMAGTPKRAAAESVLLKASRYKNIREAAAALLDDFKPLSDTEVLQSTGWPPHKLLVKYGLELSDGNTVRLAR